MAANAAPRKILRIDEDRCDGCGLCVPSCVEAAIQVIDGKARLVAEVFCDGLGACLGECPRGAISLEERVAEDFDPEAVEKYLAGLRTPGRTATTTHAPPAHAPAKPGSGAPDSAPRTPSQANHGCPGSTPRRVDASATPAGGHDDQPRGSCLSTWPVKLALVQPTAPFLAGADLLVCADCVPFAVPDFHRRYLEGRVLLAGCPKLGNAEAYREKLQAIATRARPTSMTVLRMEVPCCGGISQAAIHALLAADPLLPLEVHTVSINGAIRRDVITPRA